MLLSSSRPDAPLPLLTKKSQPTKQAPPISSQQTWRRPPPWRIPPRCHRATRKDWQLQLPGNDGLAMGGGFGGSGAFRYFSRQNSWCGLLVRDQPARQATINQHAATWQKGIGCTFCRAKPSPYKIEGEGGQFDSTKQKNIIVLVWCALELYTDSLFPIFYRSSIFQINLLDTTNMLE